MKLNPWKLSTLVLGSALALSFASGPADSAPQPQMKKALANLQTAKDHLQKATADKGGHRVKALSLVNQAIDEVKAGVAFDNTH
jgi:outer membrane lipoprotein-sorting protein